MTGFMRRTSPGLLAGAIAFVLLLAGGGCSDRNVARQVAALNDTNLKKVASLYRFYQARNGWVGPKDAAALKAFTEQAPKRNLELMRIDPTKFDSFLVSERDGKPVKVRWGLSIAPQDVQPIVFEADGVDGRRIVVFSSSEAEEADSARYDELWSGKGKPRTAVDRSEATAEARPAA
jgi:hypothetical protein